MNEKNSAPAADELPVSDAVREAMAITVRGCDELLIESDFAQKLARSEKTGNRSASSWGWIRLHRICIWVIRLY